MEELKPCPFCGCIMASRCIQEYKQTSTTGKSNKWGIVCLSCYGKVVVRSRDQAIENWNKRIRHTRTEHPDLDKLRAENKRLNDLVRKQGVELMEKKRAIDEAIRKLEDLKLEVMSR